MVLGISVFPNLWLIGLLFGLIYGYEISKDYQNKPPRANIISKAIITIGQKVAKFYLAIYDTIYGIWFMYKMGQLSYDYNKQYSKLDKEIWNSRKGRCLECMLYTRKKNFDVWGQNNEIGRCVLASFWTAWLIEENGM
jgi:hypothetical protein